MTRPSPGAFDLRPRLQRNGGVVMHHGAMTVNKELSDALTEVVEWLKTHPDELVVAYMNHADSQGRESEDEVIGNVEEYLKEKGFSVYTQFGKLSTMSVGQARSEFRLPSGGSLLIFFEHVYEQYVQSAQNCCNWFGDVHPASKSDSLPASVSVQKFWGEVAREERGVRATRREMRLRGRSQEAEEMSEDALEEMREKEKEEDMRAEEDLRIVFEGLKGDLRGNGKEEGESEWESKAIGSMDEREIENLNAMLEAVERVRGRLGEEAVEKFRERMEGGPLRDDEGPQKPSSEFALQAGWNLWSCYGRGRGKAFAQMKRYTDWSWKVNRNLLTIMQAHWQATGGSVIVGTLFGSSLLKDAQKSGINRWMKGEVEGMGSKGRLNFLEVDDVCDSGQELAAVVLERARKLGGKYSDGGGSEEVREEEEAEQLIQEFSREGEAERTLGGDRRANSFGGLEVETGDGDLWMMPGSPPFESSNGQRDEVTVGEVATQRVRGGDLASNKKSIAPFFNAHRSIDILGEDRELEGAEQFVSDTNQKETIDTKDAEEIN
uniref:Uncharacterized protein n=1 Tax=Chromera velia CCMP2878 TaxID=1169474 RepID=A0A0G4I496_9ALVE|eukprot:Cvel_10868.t1-p1 / transcript=Cvel_10868.t1 / gene=Cvel_10868 / organism=Chromera_velia_CCMP2878 / gene_product=hypothetical protein / transcript_product=hypothetical protein / location=Cvel_scaffold666:10580-14348(+) / protein_length=548 / sequence_SO=supercontig / SO=protein_coding / is_pseudo=false